MKVCLPEVFGLPSAKRENAFKDGEGKGIRKKIPRRKWLKKSAKSGTFPSIVTQRNQRLKKALENNQDMICVREAKIKVRNKICFHDAKRHLHLRA